MNLQGIKVFKSQFGAPLKVLDYVSRELIHGIKFGS